MLAVTSAKEKYKKENINFSCMTSYIEIKDNEKKNKINFQNKRKNQDCQIVVNSMLRCGTSIIKIADWLKKQKKITSSKAENIIKKQIAEIGKRIKNTQKIDSLAISIEQREEIIEKLIKNENYKLAIDAIESRDKLLGLYELNNSQKKLNQNTLAELTKLVDLE